MRVLKGNRKYCVVCAFWSRPIVRFANVVQHTNLRTGHGDGLRHSSGCLRREGSDANGRKPFDKLHGVALPEPQKLRDASQCSILTCSTEVRRMPQELAKGQEVSGTGWQRGNPSFDDMIAIFRIHQPSGLVCGASAGHIKLGSCTECLSGFPHKVHVGVQTLR